MFSLKEVNVTIIKPHPFAKSIGKFQSCTRLRKYDDDSSKDLCVRQKEKSGKHRHCIGPTKLRGSCK